MITAAASAESTKDSRCFSWSASALCEMSGGVEARGVDSVGGLELSGCWVVDSGGRVLDARRGAREPPTDGFDGGGSTVRTIGDDVAPAFVANVEGSG